MAASVSYKINGKYDGKAVTQAQSGMSQLQSSAQTLKSALGGLAAGVSVAALVAQFKECTKTFKENNTAQTQMFQALSNNTKIAEDSIKGLVQEFNNMSGLFSGDALVKGGTLLARMGLDEDQMRKSAKAAKDLAASGLMSLDQAFDALGKSYNGNIASLKKLFPELSKLTEEELKAGKAVDILSQKFSGMEDAMSNTFEGQLTILKDKIDGIKDTIGTMGGFFMQESFQDLSNLIDKVKKVADEMMPSIAAWASTIVHAFANFDIKKIFDPKTTFEAWKNMFMVMAKNFLAVFDYLKSKITGVWSESKLKSEQSMLETMKNNYSVAAANLANQRRPSAMEQESVREMKISIEQLEDEIAQQQELMKIKGKSLAELMSEMAYNTGEGLKANLGLLSGEDLSAYYEGVKAQYGVYQTSNFTNGGTEGGGDGGNGGDDGTTTGTAPLRWQSLYDYMEEQKAKDEAKKQQDKENTQSILGQFGQLGEIIVAAISGSWMGVILTAIGEVVSMLTEKSSVFNKLINIITSACEILVSPDMVRFIDAFSGPVLNGLLAVVRSVVYVLDPIMRGLTPIFQVIGKAVDFIGRTVETIGAVIYNIFVACWNFFHIGTWNDKAYKDTDLIWEGFNDWDSLSSSTYSTDSALASSSASYSAQRDIYVTINYSHSFVNGDAREIAVQLRNEIASAERLGY